MKQTGLTKYLKTLINLDILAREVPVTEDNPENSKRGLYKIKDNFMLFWFKFIFPNLSYIESGHAELAMKKIRTNFVDAHVSYVYEDVCIEKMRDLELKAKQVEWKRGMLKDYFILFSVNGFSDELTELSKARKDLILMS